MQLLDTCQSENELWTSNHYYVSHFTLLSRLASLFSRAGTQCTSLHSARCPYRKDTQCTSLNPVMCTCRKIPVPAINLSACSSTVFRTADSRLFIVSQQWYAGHNPISETSDARRSGLAIDASYRTSGLIKVCRIGSEPETPLLKLRNNCQTIAQNRNSPSQ